MTKDTISTLYSFIARIISLLEEELDVLGQDTPKNKIMLKKHITDALNKLVTLIIQLNKLGKDEKYQKNHIMKKEDEAIIAEFLGRAADKRHYEEVHRMKQSREFDHHAASSARGDKSFYI